MCVAVNSVVVVGLFLAWLETHLCLFSFFFFSPCLPPSSSLFHGHEIDFGVSRVISQTITKATGMVGTMKTMGEAPFFTNPTVFFCFSLSLLFDMFLLLFLSLLNHARFPSSSNELSDTQKSSFVPLLLYCFSFLFSLFWFSFFSSLNGWISCV